MVLGLRAAPAQRNAFLRQNVEGYEQEEAQMQRVLASSLRHRSQDAKMHRMYRRPYGGVLLWPNVEQSRANKKKMHRMLYITNVAKEKRAVALQQARLQADVAQNAFQHVDGRHWEDADQQVSDLQSMLCESQGCGEGAKQKYAAAEAASEDTVRDASCNGLFQEVASQSGQPLRHRVASLAPPGVCALYSVCRR